MTVYPPLVMVYRFDSESTASLVAHNLRAAGIDAGIQEVKVTLGSMWEVWVEKVERDSK